MDRLITHSEVPAIIQTGRFVSVDFIKKSTNRSRTITGRVGVFAHTKGGRIAYDPGERGMIVMYETTKSNRRGEKDAGYRMVTIDRITGIRANGESFIVAH